MELILSLCIGYAFHKTLIKKTKAKKSKNEPNKELKQVKVKYY